jgi:hypothetical protein
MMFQNKKQNNKEYNWALAQSNSCSNELIDAPRELPRISNRELDLHEMALNNWKHACIKLKKDVDDNFNKCHQLWQVVKLII